MPLCQSCSGRWTEQFQKKTIWPAWIPYALFYNSNSWDHMNSEKDLGFICMSWVPMFLGEWRLVALSFRRHSMFYCLYLFCSWGFVGVGVESRLHTQALLPTKCRNVAIKLFTFLPKLEVMSIPRQRPIRKRKKICFLFGLIAQGIEIHDWSHGYSWLNHAQILLLHERLDQRKL